MNARFLGVSDVLAIDDDEALTNFRLLDGMADTIGDEVAAKLIAEIKPGGTARPGGTGENRTTRKGIG